MLGTQATTDDKKGVYKALSLFLIVISVFFVIKIVGGFRGQEGKTGEMHTITVTGSGEVQAVPDIAMVNFSIVKTAKTVKEAQEQVTAIETKALEALEKNKIEKKDIKTTDSSFYPTYEYKYGAPEVACYGYGCPPVNRNMAISGYEVRESIEVKVRNTEVLGTLMEELGSLGVSSLSGPNFMVEDEDALKLDARKIAIDKAKTQAEILAKDLGVRLGRVASFSEGGYYPMYAKAESMALDSSAGSSAPALPVGEQTISSNVTITYEIR